MQRTRRVPAALLLALLSLGETTGQNPPPWDPTLSGTTINWETGRPMPGVALHLVPFETGVAYRQPTVTDFPLLAVSDDEGRFVVEAVRPGRYRLAPVLDGYVYARPEHLVAPVAPGVVLQVEPRQPIDGIEVGLVPEAVITGQVFRPNGSPHSNTRIRLFRNGYDDYGRPTPIDVPGVSSVRTDDRGQYRFFGLQPGEYFIGSYGTTNWPGTTYFPGTTDASRARPVSVEPGNEARVPAMTIADGRARPNVPGPTTPVRFRFTDASAPGWAPASIVIPGVRGVISLFGAGPLEEMGIEMPPGTHEVLAIWPATSGLAYSRMRLDVGTEPLSLDVVSDGPPMRTSGRILMRADGELAEAVGVSCQLRTEAYLSPPNQSCIEADIVPGDYRIELSGLPNDAYVVSATASGADFLTGSVRIESRVGNIEIDVVLARPGAVVEGLATDAAGTPLSDAVVALVPAIPLRTSGLFYRSSVTDFNGRYRIEGVAPGSYRLYAWRELEGAAYRNAEFMAAYEDQGVPVAIEDPETMTTDITAF